MNKWDAAGRVRLIQLVLRGDSFEFKYNDLGFWRRGRKAGRGGEGGTEEALLEVWRHQLSQKKEPNNKHTTYSEGRDRTGSVRTRHPHQ